MSRFTYPATLTPDKKDGGYVVTFRDLSEAITQGDTIKECLTEAADCLEEAIAARITDGLIFRSPRAIGAASDRSRCLAKWRSRRPSISPCATQA